MGLPMWEAAQLLEVLGCEHDPVHRRGRETTVAELASDLDGCDARKVWIEYYTAGPKRRRGTVYSMVLERIRTY